MNRRDFVLAAATGAILPRTTFAQSNRVFRIGWLSSDKASGSPSMAEFRAGLREQGYIEGRNLVIDERWGDGSPEHSDRDANELVRSKVELIVTQGGTTINLLRAKPPMPVVFGYSGDPVEAGIAATLARPGRNFTGISFLALELVGKRMELLGEMLPSLKRVAVLANPHHAGEQNELRVSQAAAKSLGFTLQYFPAQTAERVRDALTAIQKSGCEAIDVFPDALTMRSGPEIAEFAQKHRLPTISGWARFAQSGNLMSYGPNLPVVYRRLAGYVDKIFKGVDPATLPIELPTTVELVVNLRTAKSMAVGIPQSVLVRANRLIE